MSYAKAGGRTALNLGKKREKHRLRIAGNQQPRPADRGGFPRIPRGVIEKLLNEKKKGAR